MLLLAVVVEELFWFSTYRNLLAESVYVHTGVTFTGVLATPGRR